MKIEGCLDRTYRYFENNKRVCEYGIKYLDDKLKGIRKGELVLIGARSGAGKSTVAEMIALHNAKRGVKTHLFSLENFEDDGFIKRLYYKYKEITQDYFLRIEDFVCGDFKIDELKLIEAEKLVYNEYENLEITSRQIKYDIKKLKEDMIRSVEGGTQFMVIDHLDYVDKDNPNENDNTYISELMSTIRELQDLYKIPIVAISHLRKSANPRFNPKVPSMDEFHGSSNKVKQATTVIMFAPDDESNVGNETKKKLTWCCIRKNRLAGIDNKVARLSFNLTTGRYDDWYELCWVSYSGEVKQLEKGE